MPHARASPCPCRASRSALAHAPAWACRPAEEAGGGAAAPSAPAPTQSDAGAAAMEASPSAAPPERAEGEEPEEGELPEEGEVAGAPAHEAPAKRSRLGGLAVSDGAHRRAALCAVRRAHGPHCCTHGSGCSAPVRAAEHCSVEECVLLGSVNVTDGIPGKVRGNKPLCACRAAPWGAAEGVGHSLAGAAGAHNGQAYTDGGQGGLGHAAGYPDMYMHAGGAPNGYPAPGEGWRDHDAHPDALRGAPPPSAHNVF